MNDFATKWRCDSSRRQRLGEFIEGRYWRRCEGSSEHFHQHGVREASRQYSHQHVMMLPEDLASGH